MVLRMIGRLGCALVAGLALTKNEAAAQEAAAVRSAGAARKLQLDVGVDVGVDIGIGDIVDVDVGLGVNITVPEIDLSPYLRTIFQQINETYAGVLLLAETTALRCEDTDEVDDGFAALLDALNLALNDLGGPVAIKLRKCYYNYARNKIDALSARVGTRAQFKINVFVLLSNDEFKAWLGFDAGAAIGDAPEDPETPETEDPETEDPETEDPETEDPETKDPETEDPETPDGDAEDEPEEPATPPKAKDWVGTAIPEAAQNQGRCGGCWAFSAAETIAAVNWIENQQSRNQQTFTLSAQQLISCDTDNGNKGCNGGNYQNVWGGSKPYTATKPLVSLASYPYESAGGEAPSCSAEASADGLVTATRNNVVKSTLKSYATNELAVKELAKRPMSMAIVAAAACFQYYAGGTLSVEDCAEDMSTAGDSCPLDHAIVLVGYDNYNAEGDLTFKVKNSWGSSWGDNGYAYLANDFDFSSYDCKGLLGMNMMLAYPSLTGQTAAGDNSTSNPDQGNPKSAASSIVASFMLTTAVLAASAWV